jgi:hypothetical protein
MVGRIYDDKEPSEPPRIRTPTRTSENTPFYELRRPARPSARAPWTISIHRAPLGSWARNLSSVRFVFPRLRNSPVSAELLRDPFSDVAQLGSRMRCAGLHCVACSEVLVARNTCEVKVGRRGSPGTLQRCCGGFPYGLRLCSGSWLFRRALGSPQRAGTHRSHQGASTHRSYRGASPRRNHPREAKAN